MMSNWLKKSKQQMAVSPQEMMQRKLLTLMTTNQNRNSTLVTKSWIRQPAKMELSMDW